MAFSAIDTELLMADVAALIGAGSGAWFYDFGQSKWACQLGTDVVTFQREEGDSIVLNHQHVALLFLEHMAGWDEIDSQLSKHEAVDPAELPHGDVAFEKAQAGIRMRVLEAFSARLAQMQKAA